MAEAFLKARKQDRHSTIQQDVLADSQDREDNGLDSDLFGLLSREEEARRSKERFMPHDLFVGNIYRLLN